MLGVVVVAVVAVSRLWFSAGPKRSAPPPAACAELQATVDFAAAGCAGLRVRVGDGGCCRLS